MTQKLNLDYSIMVGDFTWFHTRQGACIAAMWLGMQHSVNVTVWCIYDKWYLEADFTEKIFMTFPVIKDINQLA